jgi:hypothetical protein
MRSYSKSLSPIRLILAVQSCLVAAGCQSARIAGQGIGFRDALVKMYDDQVWDSLIRAKQNKPFVLLNYTELFGQDAEQVDVSGSGGEFVPSLRGAKNGWLVAGSAQRSGLLNFKAAPVGNGNVISSVVRFARERLKESPSKPPSCYDYRVRDGRYYFIIAEDASVFMDLALRASFPIDDEAAQLGFYMLTIAAISPEPRDPQVKNSDVAVRFTFTGPVPNGGGLLSTSLGAYELRPVPNRIAGEGTRELIATWRDEYRPRDPNDLKGKSGRFFSTDYPPCFKSPAEQNVELLQKVINSVDRLGA